MTRFFFGRQYSSNFPSLLSHHLLFGSLVHLISCPIPLCWIKILLWIKIFIGILLCCFFSNQLALWKTIIILVYSSNLWKWKHVTVKSLYGNEHKCKSAVVLGFIFSCFGLKLEQANNQIMPNAAVFNGPSQRGEMK